MKVFYPLKFKMVPAHGHGENAEYKVSYGTEYWGEMPKNVFKVQMVYDGQVSGRRSPSYLEGEEDYLNVHKAMLEIMEEVENEKSKKE